MARSKVTAYRKKNNVLKLILYLAVIAALFAALIIINQQANKASSNNVYGIPSSQLSPQTRALLDDPNYQNIILPDELDRKIADKESFFVYFFSATCPFCIQTTPKLTPIIGEVGVDVKQFNLDVFDEGYGKYNIIYTPTLVFFENGVEKERIEGGIVEGNDTITEETYRSFFERYKEAASS